MPNLRTNLPYKIILISGTYSLTILFLTICGLTACGTSTDVPMSSSDYVSPSDYVSSSESSVERGASGGSRDPDSAKKASTDVNNSNSLRIQGFGADEGEGASPGALQPGPEFPEFNTLPKRTSHTSEIIGIFPFFRTSGSVNSVLSLDREGVALLWDLEASEAVELYQIPNGANRAAFSSDGRLLAVSQGPAIRVCSLTSGVELYSSERLKAKVTSLAFHPNGRSLVIGGADGRVYRWRFVDEEAAETLKDRDKALERYIGHSSIVSSVVYHPHGRVFLSGDWKGGLSAWLHYDADSFRGEYDKNLFGARFFSEKAVRRRGARKNSESIEQLKVSDDGHYFLVALQNGTIELWKIRGFKQVGEVQAHKGLVYSMLFGADSKKVVSAGRDGTLKVWVLEENLERDVQAVAKGEFLFKPDRVASVTGIRELVFLSQDRVLAGTVEGEILDIDLDGLDQVVEEVKEDRKSKTP